MHTHAEALNGKVLSVAKPDSDMQAGLRERAPAVAIEHFGRLIHVLLACRSNVPYLECTLGMVASFHCALGCSICRLYRIHSTMFSLARRELGVGHEALGLQSEVT